MLHLRERGIRTYDFGGIAVGAEAAARRGINDFKVGFGGRVVREDHWLSPLYALASAIGAR
jgi:lipid II:glycine glycyltransferase (peptidoglycan interpeptide bridge formation enzyme)